MSPFPMSIKVPKKITCLSINYNEIMTTCICVNTDNVTLLTTLTFKIMSPKILNSQCILIHSCPIHCVPNELCMKKISTRHFLTELENNDSRRLLWHCLISSSLNQNWTSQLNFVVFLEDFQRNHEQRVWHWSMWFLHVSPLQPDICENHKWFLYFIWPQAVSIHWISCRYGKPLYMLFHNTSPINLKMPYLMPDIANATVPNLTYFIKENKSG